MTYHLGLRLEKKSARFVIILIFPAQQNALIYSCKGKLNVYGSRCQFGPVPMRFSNKEGPSLSEMKILKLGAIYSSSCAKFISG